MITEDYVSFEIAKLLKEKGFEQYKCQHSYNSKGVFQWSDNLDPYEYSAPTLQMAMKWLREVHNIHIVVHPYTDKEGQCWSFIFDTFAYNCWQELGVYITDYWSSYEQACEAAIKYCLENLI